ncbi:unnamed protein product, partial [marine sediment metagenome]
QDSLETWDPVIEFEARQMKGKFLQESMLYL